MSRTVLTADTTIYVNVHATGTQPGSDVTGDGSIDYPFQSYAKAIDEFYKLDTNLFTTTIKPNTPGLAGNYPSPASGQPVIQIDGPWYGDGPLVIEGNPSNIYSVSLRPTSADSIYVTGSIPNDVTFNGFEFYGGLNGLHNTARGARCFARNMGCSTLSGYAFNVTDKDSLTVIDGHTELNGDMQALIRSDSGRVDHHGSLTAGTSVINLSEALLRLDFGGDILFYPTITGTPTVNGYRYSLEAGANLFSFADQTKLWGSAGGLSDGNYIGRF